MLLGMFYLKLIGLLPNVNLINYICNRFFGGKFVESLHIGGYIPYFHNSWKRAENGSKTISVVFYRQRKLLIFFKIRFFIL